MKRLVRFALASLSLASVSLAFPALAHATDAYVTGDVNLRAGPDPDYPLIDQIQAGTEVDVQGCTDGWEWCDVIVYGNRGWIAGNYIEYEYQEQPVLLPEYGAQIGIPIVTFVIGNYWDHYYRGRPFYRERERWYSRPVMRRSPPQPLSHPYSGGPIHAYGQWHGHDQNRYDPNRPAPQYPHDQRAQHPMQQGQDPAQWHRTNENRAAQPYERSALPAGPVQRDPHQWQTHGASENRPVPQYQRAPQPATPSRGETQSHGDRGGKSDEHKKDEHHDNNGH